MTNFGLNKKEDEEADVIRERNLDRLKVLTNHEESRRRARGDQSFHNYTEREEEEVFNGLERQNNKN